MPKSHCKIQVRTILVCTLYPIKYGTALLQNANILAKLAYPIGINYA